MHEPVTVEVELSGGRVFTGNLIGPQFWVEFFEQHPMPLEPKKVHQNEAGMDVEVSYEEGDQEYLEWAKALDDLVKLQKETAWLWFFEGRLEVPEDWEVPAALQWAGVKPEKDVFKRMLQYIRYAVILTIDDENAIAEAARNEITREEVAAAGELFQGDDGQREEAEAVTVNS